MKYLKPNEFPYQVEVKESFIPLSDGTQLFMKAWMPVTDQPVPAILEYLPYRATDWTLPRDTERHPYYAGHGYASIRVDIRGHGNSEGVPGDEYDAQEHADGVEVINWIAQQDWCSGKVGMFGISWGGFNSLQMNYMQPEPLKAIVTVCSTDDRYDNDVHYMGGSMLGIDMHAWGATMLAFESRPADPLYVGDKWRDMWRHRLENMDPYIEEWMSHQTRDEYWKHGSVCEDYSRMNAAVLAVGGWFDPYRDTVLRLVENLSALGKNVKGLIGPWSHQYPDRSLRPGPYIDFLGETLRWWDHWLKGENNDVMDEPLLRTYMMDSVRPKSIYDEMPGRWIAEEPWPSLQVEARSFALNDASVPLVAKIADDTVLVHSPHGTGRDAGRYFPYGNDADLPVDQRSEDGRAVTFDFRVFEDIEILGNASVNLKVKSAGPRGQIYARLLDVAPDGSSMMITRGNLNLSAREGRDRIVDMPADKWVDLSFPMTGIGYKVPAGHVLRVALSTAYWPWIWPQGTDNPVELSLSGSHVSVPVRTVGVTELDKSVSFDGPVQPEPVNVQYPEHGRGGVRRPERVVSTDAVKSETLLEVDPSYGGTRIYPDGLHYDEDTIERYWIQDDDPTTARTEAIWKVGLSRPDMDWETSLEATTRISCDASKFYVTSIITCWEGNKEFFHKEWNTEIERTAS